MFLGVSSVVGVHNVMICIMSFSSARSESIEDGRASQIRNDNRNSADPCVMRGGSKEIICLNKLKEERGKSRTVFKFRGYIYFYIARP